MNSGGIKYRKRASLNGYQQTDLRAAEDHSFSPLLREFFDDADVEGAGGFAEGAETELVKDNLIDAHPVFFFRDQAFDPKLAAQTPAIEILLHGVACAQQRYAAHPGCRNCAPGRVSDMQERQRAAVLNMRCHLVHGIGTKQYPLGASPLQPQRRLGQDRPGFIPLAARLAGFDIMKINAVQQQACGVQPPQTLLNPFVNQAIIRDCRFPAHST